MIRLFVLDVDGVLTDGRLYFSAAGEQGKYFHVHDGQGLRLLQQHGFKIAIISARESQATALRLAELNIEFVFLGQKNKLEKLDQLCQQLAIPKNDVAYMGDDLADLACMQSVGLAIAPANAVNAIKSIAHIQTEKSGGFGAVREACEYLLASAPDLSAAKKEEMVIKNSSD